MANDFSWEKLLFGPPATGSNDPEISEFLSRDQRKDDGFSSWYSNIAEQVSDSTFTLNPDPDAPKHYYDYRAAYEAGAELDERKHLPSEFKHDLHPDRYVIDKKTLEIRDSKYERKASLEDMIIQSFQRKEYEEELFK